MSAFGPTFVDELIAAGLGGLPFAWIAETGEINGRASLTTQQNAAPDAVIAAHDPTKQRVVVPQQISDRQFFQQLAVQGIIGQADALAAVKTGAMPADLQALINQLPADQQFAATMLISGATVFERNHPLTVGIGTAYGWSSAQIDALFIAAAAL
jgi:hypothetical protein